MTLFMNWEKMVIKAQYNHNLRRVLIGFSEYI